MSHHCHARGCGNPCAPERLMCPPHWAMVPCSLQTAVWKNYQQGQCDVLAKVVPSLAWHAAADATIGFVAYKEKQPVTKRQWEALKFFEFNERDGKLTRALVGDEPRREPVVR